jgi:SAM-dependent methyltransferase
MNNIDVLQKEWHIKWYQDILEGGPEKWDGFINPDSIWSWMHTYCIDHIKEFFQNIPPSTIITLGDGYCGREAIHIKRFGFGHHVHASDFQPCLIEVAHKMGLVDDFSNQDMGNLTFEEGAFDFVFIKESLHHMSMPYKGLYEMFRVAKKGVILIEPSGDNEYQYHFNNYEPTGNYMFGFSSHELIKIGLAYGIKNFAWTYSSVHFGRHNIDNINSGKIEEEKKRLICLDNQTPLKDRPLLIFFFLKDEKLLDIFADENKFKRIRRE